ncbi:hypothetical protein PR202_gb26133 [Eleusine coracana subsp. coracana]|uniref:Dilute domain-containing protein n=1 Tax=Eleusine coracana subsp. coracana TaxID=191504 RepID=A0AAV5FQR7_ELECO|nr:hypothetical protein PR202_gb26133 [Eleusine coracana subsp. coracana]
MVSSFQEKLTTMEAENQLIRQQALLRTPVRTIPENRSPKSVCGLFIYSFLFHWQKLVIIFIFVSCTNVALLVLLANITNGSPLSEEQKTPHGTPPAYGSFAHARASFYERQHESVDALINCVSDNIGFSEGKPVAAITIYKCLVHWKIFETEKTSVFDQLIQIFGSAMQKHDSNEDLAYWLSNSSTLLIMLQKSLKAAGSSGTTPQKRPQTQSSFLGRMVFRSSNITVDMDLVRQIEAKYPAFLFKQQLTAFVEGLYGMIRDNVKKDLSSLLSHAIQVPRTMKASMVIFKKFRISYDEIINDLCPVLSVQQLYKICTQYWDDKYNTESVSEEVLEEMRTLMTKELSQDSSANTFLLDDEISMPISLEEIADSMDAKEFQNIAPPSELVAIPAFQFLKS